MPELEYPLSERQSVQLPTQLPSTERPPAGALPIETSAPESLGLCLWLTASHPEALRGVSEELWTRLGGTASQVEILGIDTPGREPSLTDSPASRSAIVATLAQAASALVRRGISVIVAYPLSSQDRRTAHDLAGRMVEIFLRTTPREQPHDNIPVIYRTFENGQVREREMSLGLAPPGRPDVILGGNSRGATETAVDILDALTRAGWIEPGGPLPKLGQPIPT
jgi:adenylylsulfate kinase-like enzyme